MSTHDDQSEADGACDDYEKVLETLGKADEFRVELSLIRTSHRNATWGVFAKTR